MVEPKKKQEGLTPVDYDQCQAEVPNGYSFMTLGGQPGRVRCKNKPAYIVSEDEPGEDGLRGAMSMCSACYSVFKKQNPKMKHTAWYKQPRLEKKNGNKQAGSAGQSRRP